MRTIALEGKKGEKFAVVQRPITNGNWVIKILESGDTELCTIGSEGSVTWSTWADKDLYQEVWINTEENEDYYEEDTSITEFATLAKALAFLNSIAV